METFGPICENAAVYEESVNVVVESLQLLAIRVKQTKAMVVCE